MLAKCLFGIYLIFLFVVSLCLHLFPVDESVRSRILIALLCPTNNPVRNQRCRLCTVHVSQQNHLSVLCVATRINKLVLLESSQLSRYRTIYSIRWVRCKKLEAKIKLVCSDLCFVCVFLLFWFWYTNHWSFPSKTKYIYYGFSFVLRILCLWTLNF